MIRSPVRKIIVCQDQGDVVSCVIINVDMRLSVGELAIDLPLTRLLQHALSSVSLLAVDPTVRSLCSLQRFVGAQAVITELSPSYSELFWWSSGQKNAKV